MKDKTAVLCHNIVKCSREHKTPEMTPAQVMENLKFITDTNLIKGLGAEYDELVESVKQAASIVQKVISGELIPMPAPQIDAYEGLKIKYRVFHAEDNTPVKGDCFVLRPDKDIAALVALKMYGIYTDNKQLKDDIKRWAAKIEKDGVPRENC